MREIEKRIEREAWLEREKGRKEDISDKEREPHRDR